MMHSIRLCVVTQVAIIAVYFVTFPFLASLFKLDAASLASVLIPLSIAQIVHGLTGPVGSLLLMSGHEKLVAAISISVAIGSLVSGYMATLWFRASGAWHRNRYDADFAKYTICSGYVANGKIPAFCRRGWYLQIAKENCLVVS